MTELTFRSGVTVKVRPLNPITLMEAQSRFKLKPPVAPTQEVPSGPNGETLVVDNENDPSYIRALMEYNDAVSQKTNRLAIDLAVDCEVDEEAVERFKKAASAEGVEFEGSDKYVYVVHVAVGGIDEWNALMDAINGNEVKEAAVEAASNTF